MVSRPLLAVTAIALWIGLLIAGFAVWELYDVTPTPWAGDTQSRPASGFRYEIVMFVHPHCPCTRASLRELAGVVRESPDITVRVVFVLPVSSPAGWERGHTWDMANKFEFARVSCDVGGAEARLAGATTSGMVVVYDETGMVVFRGGMTRARGRDGENSGRQSITALLNGTPPLTRETPAFGCPLLDVSGCANPNGCETPCPR